MKVVNIILLILLVLFVVLNIYYLFYVRRECLEKELKREKFLTFQDAYTDEQYDTDNTFRLCNLGDSQCTNTFSSLESNDADFHKTYSLYHENYSLPLIQANNYSKYNDVMTMKSLLSYRCLKTSPKALKAAIEEATISGGPIPTIYKKMYLFNEDDLYAYIATLLNDVKSTLIDNSKNKSTSKILTPVYVCISQAPFLSYQDEMIKSRFDVTHNKRGFYKETKIGGKREYELETGNEVSDSISSLYTEILLVFPLYTLSEGKYAFVDNQSRLNSFLNAIVAPLISRDQLCFLRCNKSSLSCGCLNATQNDMKLNAETKEPYIKEDINTKSIQQYKSTCLDHTDQETNYSLLYYLNPYSGEFKDLLMNTAKADALTNP
jgi:hypothetical protein